MTSDLADRIAALTERRVSVEELHAAVHGPISDAEREDVLSLVSWFTKRYPTGAERLAYVRLSHQRWRRFTCMPSSADGP